MFQLWTTVNLKIWPLYMKFFSLWVGIDLKPIKLGRGSSQFKRRWWWKSQCQNVHIILVSFHF